MRRKYHFCVSYTKHLEKYLQEEAIRYNVAENLLAFDLYDDDMAYHLFIKRCPWHRFDSFYSIEYSQKEMEEAEWFYIHSTTHKIPWIYEEDAYEKTCMHRRFFSKDPYYRHKTQIGEPTSSRRVKWTSRQFFAGPETSDDLLFCSEKAKSILGDGWKGLNYLRVKKENSSKYIPDLYQLFFDKQLPFEALQGGRCIKCRYCGKPIIRIKEDEADLRIKRGFLNDSKCVFSTGDVLTGEILGFSTYSINIVPRDFYLFCMKSKINKGLLFNPVMLID